MAAAPTSALQPEGKAGTGPRRRRGCLEGIEEAPEMDCSPTGTGKTGANRGLTPPPAGRLRWQSQRRRKEGEKEEGGHRGEEREEERVKLGGRAQPEVEATRGTAGASEGPPEGPPEGAGPTQTTWWTRLTTPTSETKLFRGRHKLS